MTNNRQLAYAFVSDMGSGANGSFPLGGAVFVTGIVLNSDDSPAFELGIWVNFHFGDTLTILSNEIQAALNRNYPGVTLAMLV